MTINIDQWVEISKDCKYLPENDLKVCIDFFVFSFNCSGGLCNLCHSMIQTKNSKFLLKLCVLCLNCMYYFVFLIEIMWLRKWPVTGRIECSTSFFTCYSMWWYSWSGEM